MSKRTAGVVAGLAVASVAALATPISTAMASGTSSPVASTVRAGATTVLHSVASPAVAKAVSSAKVSASAVAPKPAGTHAAAAAKVAATVAAKPKPGPRPPVYKLVRKVLLQLPTAAVVGSNVSGYIQVLDDNGQVQSPVPGVRVQFQRKDFGRWTVLSDDLTDENGLLPVAFTSQTNMTVRAVYVPVKGARTPSATLNISSASQVSWAARPDMEVATHQSTIYAFRVNSGLVPTGHLEFVLASKGGKWTAAPSARVDAAGVVDARVAFPAPGTYLLRGTTGKSQTNTPGYTSVITVVVG